jgi:hypothetical protein
MILCLGIAADETFVHTLVALKRSGVRFAAIDMAQFTYSGHLEFPIDDAQAAIFTQHDTRHFLKSYRGVWARLLDVSEGAPSEPLRRRAVGIHRAVCHLLNTLEIPIINPPCQDGGNFAKLSHAIDLSSAADWYIPRSCLTNDVQRAEEFINTCADGVIFKGASGSKTWATLYESSRHARRLSRIETCPVLFQERINGPDVRVHLIGERTFAERIESAHTDYRSARGNKYEPIRLPRDIANACCTLAQLCKVPFLGIDFKIQRSSGKWFFLEANALPCYQGYDRRAGGEISRAIVEWLTSTKQLSSKCTV